MRVAVFSRLFKPEFKSGIDTVFNFVRSCGGCVFFNDAIKNDVDAIWFGKDKYDFYSQEDEFEEEIDLVISFGGDGTLLETVNMVKDSNIPVLGVNFGRLGFLSSVLQDDLSSVLDLFLAKKLIVSKRSLLMIEDAVNIFGEQIYALNDIILCKSEANTMMTTHLYVNDCFVNSYWSDGLILSTPTGSTAYSLSCGGPILTPEVENFIITPIAPHNMSVRPLIVNDNDILTLIPDGRTDKFILSSDTRQTLISKKQKIVVKKAPFKINFLCRETPTFYEAMRDKLMWGVDKRN